MSTHATEPRRWLVLASFSLLTMSNSWIWITWSPIEDRLTTLWRVSDEAINQLSTVFMFSYVILGFPGLYLLDIKGLRFGLILGAFLTLAGASIRAIFATTASQSGFIAAYIGSFLAALGQLFTLAIPPLLSANWFAANERSLATGVGVVANQLGTAIGLGLTSVFVHSTEQLGHYLITQAALCLIITVLICAFVTDKPAQAPSNSAAAKENETHPTTATLSFADYSRSVVKLMHRPATRYLSLAYGLSTGVFYSIATFLAQLLPPSWDADLAGSLGLALVVVGLIGSLVGGYVLDRTHSFATVSRTYFFLSLLFVGLWTVSIHYAPSNHVLIFVVGGGVGFALTGVLSVGFEWMAEITYPVNESTTAGLLNVAAQLCGCILIWTGEWILADFGVTATNLFLTACSATAFLITVVSVGDEEYVRTAADRASLLIRTSQDNDDRRLLSEPPSPNNNI